MNKVGAVTDVDDLAGAVFRLDTGTLTTALVTARITRAAVEWATARGWMTRTEARVGVGEDARLGFVDVVVLRGPAQPDLAIEIDSVDKPWSLTKLRHAAALGMHAIWIRWGDDEWAGACADVDIIQLPVLRRPAARVGADAQLSLWR